MSWPGTEYICGEVLRLKVIKTYYHNITVHEQTMKLRIRLGILILKVRWKTLKLFFKYISQFFSIYSECAVGWLIERTAQFTLRSFWTSSRSSGNLSISKSKKLSMSFKIIQIKSSMEKQFLPLWITSNSNRWCRILEKHVVAARPLWSIANSVASWWGVRTTETRTQCRHKVKKCLSWKSPHNSTRIYCRYS